MTEEAATAPSAEAPTRTTVPLQTRGAVQPGALYVARRTDEDMVAALLAGRWALICGPRLSGKSSLRARTAQALRQRLSDADPTGERWRIATVDTRSLKAASLGSAYLALCNAVAVGLGLPPAGAFWQSHLEDAPAQRWQRYLLEEVAQPDAATVILVDDLDGLNEPPFELPELLLALRETRERLAEAGRASSLTVALFSSLHVPRLAGAASDSLFDEDELFPLRDFTRAELAAFAPTLTSLVRAEEESSADHWLDAIHAWTGGHPQLTQHLCQQLVARGLSSDAAGSQTDAAAPAERVERLVRALYLDEEPAELREQEPWLGHVVSALNASPQAQALLSLYRRLLSGTPVTPDPLEGVQQELRLAGLCTEAEDPAGTPRLRARCQLVSSVFSDDWVREQEVRLLLKDAVARLEAGEGSAQAALLRGSQLKAAQSWARRHPEALQPIELQLLLASLEAARSEAEGKHQASAAALQRELRGRAESRLRGPDAPMPAPAAPRRLAPVPPRSRIGLLAVAVMLVLVGASFLRAHRRASRSEQAFRATLARAERAEQTVQALQAEQAQAHRSAAAPEAATPGAARNPRQDSSTAGRRAPRAGDPN